MDQKLPNIAQQMYSAGKLSNLLQITTLNSEATYTPVHGKYFYLQMISGENQEVFNTIAACLIKKPHVLTHGICCALEPFFLCRCLGRCQYFNKSTRIVSPNIGIESLRQMPIQGSRIELSKTVNFIDSRINAIRNWNIDETIVSTKGHRRFCTFFGQRIQASSSTSTQDNTQDCLGDIMRSIICRAICTCRTSCCLLQLCNSLRTNRRMVSLQYKYKTIQYGSSYGYL